MLSRGPEMARTRESLELDVPWTVAHDELRKATKMQATVHM
jgi:hypothetical protein